MQGKEVYIIIAANAKGNDNVAQVIRSDNGMTNSLRKLQDAVAVYVKENIGITIYEVRNRRRHELLFPIAEIY